MLKVVSLELILNIFESSSIKLFWIMKGVIVFCTFLAISENNL